MRLSAAQSSLSFSQSSLSSLSFSLFRSILFFFLSLSLSLSLFCNFLLVLLKLRSLVFQVSGCLALAFELVRAERGRAEPGQRAQQSSAQLPPSPGLLRALSGPLSHFRFSQSVTCAQCTIVHNETRGHRRCAKVHAALKGDEGGHCKAQALRRPLSPKTGRPAAAAGTEPHSEAPGAAEHSTRESTNSTREERATRSRERERFRRERGEAPKQRKTRTT